MTVERGATTAPGPVTAPARTMAPSLMTAPVMMCDLSVWTEAPMVAEAFDDDGVTGRDMYDGAGSDHDAVADGDGRVVGSKDDSASR